MRLQDIANATECTTDKNSRDMSYCRWCPNCQIELPIGVPHFHIHAQKLIPACSVMCMMKMKKDLKAGKLVDMSDILEESRRKDDPSVYYNHIYANGLLETKDVV